MRELPQEQEQERSGLSLKAFAEAAGVATTTLAWWRARLRAEVVPPLVPVSVVECAAERGISVELVVADVLVRVADTDAQAVARLVRALAVSKLTGALHASRRARRAARKARRPAALGAAGRVPGKRRMGREGIGKGGRQLYARFATPAPL